MPKQSKHDGLMPPLWIITLLGVASVVWLLLQLKEIVILLVVGYSIAYVMNPVLEKLERRGVSRPLGVIIVALGLLTLLVVLTLTALPTLSREFTLLVENFPRYIETAQNNINQWMEVEGDGVFGSLRELWDNSSQELTSFLQGDAFKSIGHGFLKALLKGYSITLTLVNLLLLPFIVYYLAVSFADMHRWALKLFPQGRQKKVKEIALEVDGYLSAFIHGQALIGTVLSVFYSVCFGVIGVELWFLLALISGFGDLIPYFGLVIGLILTSIMTVVTFGDWEHLLLVWGVFLTAQVVVGSYLAPKVLGDKVGLSPLVVIVVLLAGGKMFGLLGIFLAVPVAAALRVLLRYSHAWLIEQSA